MAKIMVGINTLTAVEQPAYANHIQYFFRLGRNTSHDFAINTPRRMPIDRMRNMTAKLALEMEYDYVLFLDDDVIVPINSLDRMIAANADIIAGWTLVRGYPFPNMFYKFNKDGGLESYNEPKVEDDGLIECDAVGFSYCLIKCSLLRNINPPFFVTGSHNTEDIYFCMKAKSYDPKTRIVVDPSIKTFHILGPEMIGPDNKDAYKTYIEKVSPELVIKESPQDRGDEYLEMVKATCG